MNVGRSGQPFVLALKSKVFPLNALRMCTTGEQMSIPHLFRCPISLDLFTDPVTLSTGQTYDRPCIEKWLAGGNRTCPVTMQRLADTSLVPNHTLRHLIDQWLAADPDLHRRPIHLNELQLGAVKQNLQSRSATHEAKLEALRKVRSLSMDSGTGQACLIREGFFPLLLQLLFQAPQLVDLELTEIVLECVMCLSTSAQLDSLNMLKQRSSLESLVKLLEKGSIKTKTSLCYLVESIATSAETRELCLVFGQFQRLLQVLISLAHGNSNWEASEAAVRAIAGICSLEGNRRNSISEGAVDGIIAYLSNTTQKNELRALATLELLLELDEGKETLIKNPNAIDILVKKVFRVPSNHEGSELAVGSLLVVCGESRKTMVKAVDAGVLVQLLLLLQSQCSSKAKAKARALLKLLRSLWAEDTGGDNFNKDK